MNFIVTVPSSFLATLPRPLDAPSILIGPSLIFLPSSGVNVTVTLTPDQGKDIKEGPISITGAVTGSGNVVKNNDGTVTVTFTVTHNSTVTIANVPYDVSYKVTEEAGDYTATMTNDGKGDIEAASQTVDIENKLDTTIETGVNLDNLPYILVLALVGVGLISFTVRKRVRN